MMAFSLLLLCSAGLLGSLHANPAGEDSVQCYAKVNEETGHCEDYLGEGVSEQDCCRNIKYGFKQDSQSPCVACKPASWSQWGAWSPCTVSCAEGVQERRRVCIGKGDCEGAEVEVTACSLQDCCPQNGGWSEWTPWSSCSVTCERGTKKRTRQCNNPPPSCQGTCVGPDAQTDSCDTQQVCPTHGLWGNWGPWNACSATCVQDGSGILPHQVRQRWCDNPEPSTNPPGRPCEGSGQDARDCTTLPFCAVDGQWAAWQKDTECSVTCGVGRVREKRSCDNPAPRHAGRDCPGSATRHTICNTKTSCPTDGEWSEWADWSLCSRLKDEINCKKKAGKQQRRRVCEGHEHGGKWCPGDYRQSRNCYDIDKCFLKGPSWSEWSEWGLCSSPCGKSERTRYRKCLPNLQDYRQMIEEATGNVEEVFFSGTPRIRCPPIDGQTLIVEEKLECKNVPLCP